MHDGPELDEQRREYDDCAPEANVAVQARLTELVAAARGSGHMVPAMLEAVRAEATLGEICHALRAEWGTYTEPARI